MHYVIGGCADGQVEFEAECSFAIITSAACGTLCVFFKATCPTDGIGSRSSRPLQHAAVAAVVSDAKGCFHAQVICGGRASKVRHYSVISNPLLPPEISVPSLTSTAVRSSCATHGAQHRHQALAAAFSRQRLCCCTPTRRTSTAYSHSPPVQPRQICSQPVRCFVCLPSCGATTGPRQCQALLNCSHANCDIPAVGQRRDRQAEPARRILSPSCAGAAA